MGCAACGKATRSTTSPNNAKKSLTSKITKSGSSSAVPRGAYGVPSVKSSGFSIGRKK